MSPTYSISLWWCKASRQTAPTLSCGPHANFEVHYQCKRLPGHVSSYWETNPQGLLWRGWHCRPTEETVMIKWEPCHILGSVSVSPHVLPWCLKEGVLSEWLVRDVLLVRLELEVRLQRIIQQNKHMNLMFVFSMRAHTSFTVLIPFNNKEKSQSNIAVRLYFWWFSNTGSGKCQTNERSQ